MTHTAATKKKVTIEIKRPNGEIETVDVTDKFGGMCDYIFRQIQKSTKDAGRGDVLRYKIEEYTVMVELTDSDKKEIEYDRHCSKMHNAMNP